MADITLHQTYGDAIVDDAPAAALASYQRAVGYLRRAHELQSRITIADPHNLQAVRALAGTSYALARAYPLFDPTPGFRYAEQAIEIARRTLKDTPGSFVDLATLDNSKNALARAHMAAGNPARSIPLLLEALALSEQALDKSPSNLGAQERRIWNQTDLGRASIALKRWADAGRHLRSAAENVDPLVKRLPEDLFFLRDQAEIIESRGDLDLARGDREGARARYQQARQLWEKWTKLAVPSPFTKLDFDALDHKLGRL